jgi:SAM-dependent methyltransferase
MTIDNSDDTARMSAKNPVEPLGSAEQSLALETASSVRVATEVQEDVDLSELEAPSAAPDLAPRHDSVTPTSRKLAPPPKPRREPGSTSNPPSMRPPGDAGLESAFAANALKAPIAPTISYAASETSPKNEVKAESVSPASAEAVPMLTPVPGVAPLSSPPPIPRRRSNPQLAEAEDTSAPSTSRSPSDPALGRSPSAPALPDEAPRPSSSESALKSVVSPPRPVAAPPRPDSSPPAARPASVPPPASAESEPAAPSSSPPPSSSAIFAMRIIAVGESHPPPPVVADHSADPTAYPAALGTRRSSRPAPAAPDAAPPAPVPPLDSAPEIAEVPVVAPNAEAATVAVPPVAPVAPASTPLAAAPIAVLASIAAVSPDEVTEELSDEDVSPDSGEKKTSPDPDVEELGREDAISVPPEELAALQAQAQAKADAKPPPPPKRAAGPPSVPAVDPALVTASAPPPTPDPAAAKAAQRAKTRQPWWEDLFNEDFMRASAKVSDEQVRREVTFIEESLGVAAGGVVLDLGCGAGHHAVEFASRGYGVVGYDLSLYQLALAADVAQERSQKINFLQGDMREMAFEEMFDGVFCWNTTFGYFEEDKNLAVAQRVFRALRPGGMFLIDVLNRDFAAASSPQQVWYEGDSCVCMDDMSVDYISSRLRVKRSIILDDGRTKESLFSLRLYSLHELGKLLHEVGFRVTEASGHPATPGVFFGPNSPRIIMLAQRP